MRRLLIIVAASILVSACGQGTSTTNTTSNFNNSSTLTIRTDGAWSTFAPGVPNLASIQVSAPLYDRLLFFQGGKIVPYLATSWQQTPTSLKFTIRKGATCSDGTPVTASVVAQSFDSLLGITNSKTKSSTSLGEFGPGPFQTSADDASGTFTLTLGTPFGEALQSVAAGLDTFIVCPKGLVPGALNDAAYGSGPYTIASEDRTSQITMKLRPAWNWGPNGRTAKGLPGTIVYKIITNDTTAANLLLTGGLDLARVQGTDVKRLLADNRLGHFKISSYYTNPLWMNSEPGHATADPAVREAISTAVSGDAYNQAAYAGLGTVTTSLWATNAPCFASQTAQYIPKTDVAKAKSVLLAAGYTADSSGKLSKNGQPLKINLIGSAEQGAGPEYVDNQLNQVGMTVNFVNTDHVTYSSNWLQPGKFDVLVPGIAGDLVGSYISSYTGQDLPTGRNFARLHDSTIDSLILKAEEEVGSQACADWAQVQIAFLKNYYFRPLSAQNFYWFSRNPKWNFVATTSVLLPQSLS